MLALISMLSLARHYLRSAAGAVAGETGQDMVEYALIIGVISIAVVLAFMVADIEGAIGALVDRVEALINPPAP